MGGVKVADEDYVYDLKRSVERERERERARRRSENENEFGKKNE